MLIVPEPMEICSPPALRVTITPEGRSRSAMASRRAVISRWRVFGSARDSQTWTNKRAPSFISATKSTSRPALDL